MGTRKVSKLWFMASYRSFLSPDAVKSRECSYQC